MRILMLTPYLPYPPSSGGQVRSYNLIKNLAKKYEITLFSLIKNKQEERYVSELEKYCQKVQVFQRSAKPWSLANLVKAGLGRYPFLVVRNLASEERKAVEEILAKEKFDLIHAENFYVMPHIPRTNVPVLLVEQTILSRVYQHFVETLPWYLIWLRAILMIDVWKLKYWESFYWRAADYLAAVSEDDRKYLSNFILGKEIAIIPNGVDFEHFRETVYPKSEQPTVLFGAADFHWMQNKEGVKILIEVLWPKIKKQVKNSRLWIVGKIAPVALKTYLGRKEIMIEEIKDSREAYQRAWVLVAPMRSGGGSRTKFFEAMASGLPIVTTPEGIEGIPAKNGREVVVENNLTRLAKQAVKVLSDQIWAKKIGRGGKRLVKSKYDWKKSAERLSALYEKICRH